MNSFLNQFAIALVIIIINMTILCFKFIDWNWNLTQKKEQRGATKFTSYSIIPKPQTPNHKAEVKKAYDQRIEDGFYLENLLVGGNPLEEMAD